MMRNEILEITEVGDKLKKAGSNVTAQSKSISFRVHNHNENAFDCNVTKQITKYVKTKKKKNCLYRKRCKRRKSSTIEIASNGWKRQGPRSHQEVDRCRNFRVVLFDIAFKPEWNKHVVAYQSERDAGKLSCTEVPSELPSHEVGSEDQFSPLLQASDEIQHRNGEESVKSSTKSSVIISESIGNENPSKKSVHEIYDKSIEFNLTITKEAEEHNLKNREENVESVTGSSFAINESTENKSPLIESMVTVQDQPIEFNSPIQKTGKDYPQTNEEARKSLAVSTDISSNLTKNTGALSESIVSIKNHVIESSSTIERLTGRCRNINEGTTNVFTATINVDSDETTREKDIADKSLCISENEIKESSSINMNTIEKLNDSNEQKAGGTPIVQSEVIVGCNNHISSEPVCNVENSSIISDSTTEKVTGERHIISEEETSESVVGMKVNASNDSTARKSVDEIQDSFTSSKSSRYKFVNNGKFIIVSRTGTNSNENYGSEKSISCRTENQLAKSDSAAAKVDIDELHAINEKNNSKFIVVSKNITNCTDKNVMGGNTLVHRTENRHVESDRMTTKTIDKHPLSNEVPCNEIPIVPAVTISIKDKTTLNLSSGAPGKENNIYNESYDGSTPPMNQGINYSCCRIKTFSNSTSQERVSCTIFRVENLTKKNAKLIHLPKERSITVIKKPSYASVSSATTTNDYPSVFGKKRCINNILIRNVVGSDSHEGGTPVIHSAKTLKRLETFPKSSGGAISKKKRMDDEVEEIPRSNLSIHRTFSPENRLNFPRCGTNTSTQLNDIGLLEKSGEIIGNCSSEDSIATKNVENVPSKVDLIDQLTTTSIFNQITSIENIFMEDNTGTSTNSKSNSSPCVNACGTISPVDCDEDKNRETDNELKMRKETPGSSNVVAVHDSPTLWNNELTDGGISQIKITKVISNNKAYMNSSHNVGTAPKTNSIIRSENEFCRVKTVKSKAQTCDLAPKSKVGCNELLKYPENFKINAGYIQNIDEKRASYSGTQVGRIEKSKCASTDAVLNNEERAEKLQSDVDDTFADDEFTSASCSESDPSKLEDIILKIIKDLDPTSLETTVDSSSENCSSNAVGMKKLPRRRKLPKETPGSEILATDHTYAYEKSEISEALANIAVVADDYSKQVTRPSQQSLYPGRNESASISSDRKSCTSTRPENIILIKSIAQDREMVASNELNNTRKLNVPAENTTEVRRCFNQNEIHIPANRGLDWEKKSLLNKINESPISKKRLSVSNSKLKNIRVMKKIRTVAKKSREQSNGSGPGTCPDVVSDQPSEVIAMNLSALSKISVNENPSSIHTDHAYTRLESQVSDNGVTLLLRPVEKTSDVSIPDASSGSDIRSSEQMPRLKSPLVPPLCPQLKPIEENKDVYVFNDDELEEEATRTAQKMSKINSPEPKDLQPVICWKCGEASKCERMFGMHFTSLHLDSSVLQCLYCPKEFKHEENSAFEQHYIDHLRQNEENARKRALRDVWEEGNGDLGAYMKVFSKNGNLFRCLKCYHRTTSYQAMELHLQEIHHAISKRAFTCDPCGTYFSSGVAKRFHYLSCHRDTMNRCNYCYWLYMMKPSLYIHLRTCPVRLIEEDKELPRSQKQFKVDLWWIKNDIESDNWIFEHDGDLSEQRQTLAKERLSRNYS